MSNRYLNSLTGLLLVVFAAGAAAAPASVAVRSFTDDAQSEEASLNNDDFSSTAPAGPRVTAAVSQALSAAGINVVGDGGQAAAVLTGRVTAAWVNPEALPTNSVSAHFSLTDSASGAVLVEGNASGAAFDDQDAASKLGKEIARKIAR